MEKPPSTLCYDSVMWSGLRAQCVGSDSLLSLYLILEHLTQSSRSESVSPALTEAVSPLRAPDSPSGQGQEEAIYNATLKTLFSQICNLKCHGLKGCFCLIWLIHHQINENLNSSRFVSSNHKDNLRNVSHDQQSLQSNEIKQMQCNTFMAL